MKMIKFTSALLFVTITMLASCSCPPYEEKCNKADRNSEPAAAEQQVS